MSIFSSLLSFFHAEKRIGAENPNMPISASVLDSIWSYGPTRSGVQVNEFSALTFAAVFAAVRILSESIGSLPLVTYEVLPRGRRRATDHPVYRLLMTEPNPEQNATTWKETLQGHLTLWGNAFCRIRLNQGGGVAQLVPIMPDRIYPERVAGKLRYKTSNGDVFHPAEVLHIAGLGYNGVQGFSPISYTRETIALGLAAQMYGAEFFGNGTHPVGVLEHPGRLSTNAHENLRKSWEAMHRGPGNSNRPAILEEGIKWKPISIPPEDAQFLQTRKFQVHEIARIFRVPPHMLAEMDKASYASIDQQGLEFVNYSLLPWINKWEQEINRKIFPDGKYEVAFDLRQLVRGDIKSRYEAYAVGRQWGWLSANDVRENERENLLPDGTGDIYLTPLNMVPDTQLGNGPAQAAQPGAVPDAGARSLALREIERLLSLDSSALAKAAARGESAAWAGIHFGPRRDAYRRASAAVGFLASMTPEACAAAADALLESHRDAAAGALAAGTGAYLADEWRFGAQSALGFLLKGNSHEGNK